MQYSHLGSEVEIPDSLRRSGPEPFLPMPSSYWSSERLVIIVLEDVTFKDSQLTYGSQHVANRPLRLALAVSQVEIYIL